MIDFKNYPKCYGQLTLWNQSSGYLSILLDQNIGAVIYIINNVSLISSMCFLSFMIFLM